MERRRDWIGIKDTKEKEINGEKKRLGKNKGYYERKYMERRRDWVGIKDTREKGIDRDEKRLARNK